MEKGNQLFINCEQAKLRIDKDQYGAASFWEKFTYKLHLLICKLCTSYFLKSSKLSHLIHTQKVHALNPEQKSKMKEKIKHCTSTV